MMEPAESTTPRPELCICAGYEKYLGKDRYPVLNEILEHLKSGQYSHIRADVITWGIADESSAVVCIRRKADLPPEKGGPSCLAEVRFFEDGKVQLSVNGVEISSENYLGCPRPVSDIFGAVPEVVTRISWDVVDSFLDKLGFNYGYCSGVAASEYESVCSNLRFVPVYLKKEESPLSVYRSKKCLRWIQLPAKTTLERRRSFCAGDGRCKDCSSAYTNARKTNANTAKYSPGTIKSRAQPGSSYPFGFLSPTSKVKRYRGLKKEQRKGYFRLRRLQNKIEEIYTVDLCEQQSNELAEFVKSVKEEDVSRVLDDVQSEDTKDAFRQAFFDDQKRNRAGNYGNRWSMSTYRIALSIYSRSPASYDAFKSWGIFNLPSRRTLQRFSTALLQKPGPYYEFIREQAEYYQKFKEDVTAKGGKMPNGEGVLILDEVKVIGKVIWNSKNGEISGLAMDKEDIISAVDLSKELLLEEEDSGSEPAEYVMQFLWRDLSSSFDIIGPHYSSEATMTCEFTTACLMDTVHAFQAYGFKVVSVVLDGASTNLAMVKLLCGHGKGAFGLQPRQPGVDHHVVQPWFDNPGFPHLKIYFVICPTHQLKNMINQLFASKEDGAKSFQKAAKGPKFGWKEIIDMWEREKEIRDKKKGIQMVPGLTKSYIDRDSWTKLNVKPAKIMQQGAVLAELYSHANPDNEPQPDDHDRVTATYEYLEACSKIFEYGFLNTNKEAKIKSVDDSTILQNIDEGFSYFRDWSERLAAQIDDFSMTSPREKRFISWQTYDLLRVCVYSFKEFCGDYLRRNPGMYIVPMKLNGSAVETLFSQMKYSVGGKLSSINYEQAKRTLMLRKNIGGHSRVGEKGYRDTELHTMEIPLKRKK